MFNSFQEFQAGMNRIAVCIALCIQNGRNIKILAFCLMDNHFHFILYGEEADCDLFVATYKKLTAMWVTKYRGAKLSESIDIGHWFVSPQKLGEKIVYVLRNPVAAGLRVTPQGYRWSSAQLMFSDWKPLAGKTISEMGLREMRRMLNSNVILPQEWIISEDQIWAGSYVDVPMAERAFRSVGSFMFDLNNSNIDKETNEEMMADSYSLPDSEIRIKAVEHSIAYYRKDRISLCSPGERLAIARILHKDLGCNAKQLARVLHLNPEELNLLV